MSFKMSGLKNRIKIYIRKIEDSGVEENARKLKIYQMRFLVFLLGLIMILILGTAYIFLFIGKEENKIIERPKKGQDKKTVNLIINNGKDLSEISLDINAMEYTKEEFDELSERAFLSSENRILGDNKNLIHITADLNLMDMDDTKTLTITWWSDQPEILNSRGEVNREGLKTSVNVKLTEEITDGVHSKTKDLFVTILPYLREKDTIKMAASYIQEQEQRTRTDDVFILPELEDGMSVRLKTETKNEMICKLFLIIGLGAVLIIGFVIQGMKEKLKKRDEDLKNSYYGFVNKLVLLIGAGLSLKQSILLAAENESDYLIHEVKIAMNKIGAGESEKKAYYEMGRDIGITEYIKLMSLISQNISYGNSNLLNLLSEEEKYAFLKNKEEVKKKSEEISTKLLVPILLLMVVVIVILMIPAINSMK